MQDEVPKKKSAPDYNKFVSVKSEMWLTKIEGKAKAGKYSSVEAFRADIEQIGINARTYNSQGKYKFPGMPHPTCLACSEMQCLHFNP